MKDIERIQSTELAVQVQDANPANFAIEQEVAAMVGATVPQPTEPSADDARELPAQLLVFLRRALTPIQTALRTAVAAIYAHLDSRCTVYTPAAYAPFQDPSTVPPYDPMRPFVPRTLPNLLTAITAFSARKISNGSAPNDGIKDGTSLAHILCGEYANITKLIDDNEGWVWNSRPDFASFPNLSELSVNAKEVDMGTGYLYNNGGNIRKLTFAKAKSLKADFINRVHADCEFYAPEAEYIYEGIGYPPACKVMYFPKLRKAGDYQYDRWFQRTADLPTERFVIGSLISGKITNLNTCNSPRLIDFEVGADGLGGLAISLDTSSWWNPTYVLSDNPTGNDLVTDEGISTNLDQFLQNFRDHICQRLADRTGQSKLTLTLSANVYTAIMTDDDIKAELVARNWKVTDGTNNYNN